MEIRMAETKTSDQKELVDSLKNALIQRDQRIGQLELMLSKALVGSNIQVAAEVERSMLPPPPPPASHPLSPHISAETKGLYSDGWTGPLAHLVFHPGAANGEYLISFWLPANLAAKPIELNCHPGERVTLQLIPGKTVTYPLRMSSNVLTPASMRIETAPVPPQGEDRRELGVVIARVVWVEENGEG
jgi:hypothetical protein